MLLTCVQTYIHSVRMSVCPSPSPSLSRSLTHSLALSMCVCRSFRVQIFLYTDYLHQLLIVIWRALIGYRRVPCSGYSYRKIPHTSKAVPEKNTSKYRKSKITYRKSTLCLVSVSSTYANHKFSINWWAHLLRNTAKIPIAAWLDSSILILSSSIILHIMFKYSSNLTGMFLVFYSIF